MQLQLSVLWNNWLCTILRR